MEGKGCKYVRHLLSIREPGILACTVKGGAVMSPTQKHIRPPALGTLYLVCMDRSVTAFHVCTLLSYLLEKSVIRSHT